jgi:hypothetical protein
LLILCSIPRPFKFGRFGGCHVGLHEGASLGKPTLQTPDPFKDLVTILELAFGDQLTQLLLVSLPWETCRSTISSSLS